MGFLSVGNSMTDTDDIKSLFVLVDLSISAFYPFPYLLCRLPATPVQYDKEFISNLRLIFI